jgi:hypothetical protein
MFGRISVIFGRECTRGFIAGGSVLLFNRDIVRRTRRCRSECSLKYAPALFEALSDAEHCAVHADLDQLSVGASVG